MKAKETAVVLIEFQNEFCKEGGKLHDGVKGEIARQNTIPNAVKLAEGARNKGALVIHSPFLFNEKYFEDHQMQGIVKAVADGDAFREGTWGAEIIDELKPQEGDEVVGGKCTLCGFNKTNLDKLLQEGNIKNVVIGGFLTNFCVESTARTAYDKGYGVTIMKDATAATSEEEQNHAEAKIFPLLGQSLTVDQFLEQLEE
ncbi:isochorismatase family protein [Candidatus Saccharibacteria bacterium]|nr:cysteine hydrolase [Phycisphaerae bacterium]NIV98278.1 isochorismatase family protein [Candidatus Saccharibacteria bacterium]